MGFTLKKGRLVWAAFSGGNIFSYDATGCFRSTAWVTGYHVSLPWHEFAQLRLEAVHPTVLVRFFTPLAWVAAATAVVV